MTRKPAAARIKKKSTPKKPTGVTKANVKEQGNSKGKKLREEKGKRKGNLKSKTTAVQKRPKKVAFDLEEIPCAVEAAVNITRLCDHTFPSSIGSKPVAQPSCEDSGHLTYTQPGSPKHQRQVFPYTAVTSHDGLVSLIGGTQVHPNTHLGPRDEPTSRRYRGAVGKTWPLWKQTGRLNFDVQDMCISM